MSQVIDDVTRLGADGGRVPCGVLGREPGACSGYFASESMNSIGSRFLSRERARSKE
jgi:hypothetical protein